MAPGQYLVVAPMFVTADDPTARAVLLEPGLPVQDMQPGGLVSAPGVRAHATRRPEERPDPVRLEARFERFLRAAA